MTMLPNDLGNPLGEYRGSGTQLILIKGLALILGFMGAVLLCPGLMGVMTGDSTAFTFLCIGLILFGVAGMLLLRGNPNSKRRIYLFEKGLIQQSGTRQEVMRWEDVRKVERRPSNPFIAGPIFGLLYVLWSILNPPGTLLILTLKDGQEVKISQALTDETGFVNQVNDLLASSMLSPIKAELDSGRSMTSSGIVISSKGILSGSEMVGWSQLGRTELVGNKLELYRAGDEKRWTAIDLARDSMGFLIVKLIEDYRTATK